VCRGVVDSERVGERDGEYENAEQADTLHT
jgi:hypothetical protein